VVNLIGATRIRGGLSVKAVLDTTDYHTGVPIVDEDFAAIRVRRHSQHPDWELHHLTARLSIVSSLFYSV
jgi:hypothetical protein